VLLLDKLEDRTLLAAGAGGYGELPLAFEPNVGQTDDQVDFLSRGTGYSLFLTPGAAVLSLHQPAESRDGSSATGASDVLQMQLLGANPAARVASQDALPGKSNYFIGSNPAQWHVDIPTYGRVAYHGVYPGIDLLYYGNQQQLEYDFTVAPGANPAAITLAFAGAQSLNFDAQGNLVLHTSGGDVIEHAPVLYQEIGGVRQAVAGHYVLHAGGRVAFAVGAYDPDKALVVDPLLSYSSYLGGSNVDQAFSIAVDSTGSAYLTGYTGSANFPVVNPFQRTFGGGNSDAYVAKVNATGTALVYSTFLGGSGSDAGWGIAVDPTGDSRPRY
jgi:hypothetical protein